MMKLGTLYGVDVLLNTDDAHVQELATKHFQEIHRRLQRLAELEMKEAMAALKNL